MPGRIVIGSFLRSGRLTPPQATRLRGRSIRLAPGRAIRWHSTEQKEECILAVSGRIQIEAHVGRQRHVAHLHAGQCAFVPMQMPHRVVNRAHRPARYVYLTAS